MKKLKLSSLLAYALLCCAPAIGQAQTIVYNNGAPSYEYGIAISSYQEADDLPKKNSSVMPEPIGVGEEVVEVPQKETVIDHAVVFVKPAGGMQKAREMLSKLASLHQ
jgi:hypothetical protein